MFEVMSARKAADLIHDGDVVAFNGMVCMGTPLGFFPALEQRFRETGSPRRLRYLASSGFHGANRFAELPGMIEAMYAGHWTAYTGFVDPIMENRIEAYNLPQGIVALNYRAAAAGLPGFLSRAGVGTFIDPRFGNGAFNEVSRRPLSEVQVYGGREYLFYYTIRPDVCVMRGTTADPYGNITFEREGAVVDALAMAQAAHNNGGKVIVQVERLSDRQAKPHDVKVPGALVDAVYVDEHPQMIPGVEFDPLFNGDLRLNREELAAKVRELLAVNLRKRSSGDRVIARRAALEVSPGNIINLGTGLPMLVALEAFTMGRAGDDVTFTIESGVLGGIPVGPFGFGANVNVGALIAQNQQFDFYEGHGLDLTAVGALEIDEKGDVNAIRKGRKIVGAGGFNHVAISPEKLLVCTRIGVRSDLRMENGRVVLTDGIAGKFCKKVECVALASDISRAEGQEVLYITERCVLKLAPVGLELIEIAPGVDLERDVMRCFPFRPAVSPHLTRMPEECFRFD